jgi:preprotein translocase subunit SecG
MASTTNIAGCIIVLSISYILLREVFGPIFRPENVAEFVHEHHARSQTIARLGYISAQTYRGIGFLSALVFGIALLFSGPETGVQALNRWTAAFVAVWTAFTFGLAINSTYQKLIVWGREVRSKAKDPQITFPIHSGTRTPKSDRPLHPYYVGIVGFIFGTGYIFGLYTWIAAVSPITEYNSLSDDLKASLLLVSLVFGILYAFYAAGKHHLNSD